MFLAHNKNKNKVALCQKCKTPIDQASVRHLEYKGVEGQVVDLKQKAAFEAEK